MGLSFNLWLSPKNLIADCIDFLAARIETLNQRRFGRLILGSILGIVFAAGYWVSAVFFYVNIPT